ncbi:hypothetical protein 2207_scaffold2979_00010 [Bacteriophage sp.]|nr:hypothetical protein 2207_scaffold2979_00010 [Bacteriophage sp.]
MTFFAKSSNISKSHKPYRKVHTANHLQLLPKRLIKP